MAYRIQQRRDTAANWAEMNPILLEGEMGLVTDNPNQYKIGDGVHTWNELPLRGYTGTISQELGEREDAVVSQKVVSEKFSETEQKLSDIGSKVSTKVPIKTGKNIFDKSSVVKGYYIGGSGKPSENIDYFYSQPMKVEEGVSYHFNFGGNGGHALFLDKSMNIIQIFTHVTENRVIPSGVSFLKVSGRLADLDYIMICLSTDDIDTYERYTDKKDVMSLIDKIGSSDNLYKSFEKDVFINASGSEVVSSGFYTTPYIPIKGASYIDCVGQFGNPYGGGLSFYDVDKKYIYNITESSTGSALVERKYVQASEILGNAFYVRLTTYGSSKLKESGISTDAFGGKISELIENSERLGKEAVDTKKEVKSLASSVKNFETIKSKNLFDKEAITEGYFINSGNSFPKNENYFYSALIDVEGGKNYYVNKAGVGAYYAIYDSSGVKVKTEEMKKGVISIPENGATIRISAPISEADSLQFEIGEEGTSYEEFYEVKTLYQIMKNREDIGMIKGSVISPYKTISFSSTQLLSGELLEIPDTPNVKNKHAITFRAKVLQMGSFRISHGKKGYVSGIIEVDNTNIYVYKNDKPSEIAETIAHGLSISEYVHVFINVGVKVHTAEVSITTSGGQSYSKEVQWNGCSENAVVECLSGEYANVKLMLGGSAWSEKVWIFGDSYTDYWPSYMNELNATGFLLDGASGRSSKAGYESLVNELRMGKPDVVVWMLGMNDADNSSSINSSYKTYFDSAKVLCERIGIFFVPCTIPNVPERIHTFKNEYIKTNSERYINMAEVLGAEENASSWYSGLLSSDKVHPNQAGAKLIAKTLCEELPQILSYCPAK